MNYVRSPQTWLVVALIATAVTLFFTLRWWRGNSNTSLTAGQRHGRGVIAAIFAAIAVVFWIVYLGIWYASTAESRTPPPAPVCTCTEKCTDGTVNVDCPVCGAEGADLTGCTGKESEPEPEDPPKEEEYLDAVHLTNDQIAAFLAKHKLDFVKRSLPSERENRKAAVLLYMKEQGETTFFTECVNYPIKEWFPRFEELMNPDLTMEQRLELEAAFFDALDQEMISNLPFGAMVLEGMKDIPYIYKNNAWWIDEGLAIWNSFYDGGYQQDLTSELELHHIPALDPDKFVGLDYLVVNKTVGLQSGLQVREEWAKLVARMSAAMRCYALRTSGDMVVERTTTVSWRDSGESEDSRFRLEKDDQSESHDVLVLSGIAKSGNERTLIGFNRYDSRLEIFVPGTPDKPKEEPPKEEKKPDEPKTPATVTYNVYRVGKKADGTILYEKEWVASPALNKAKTVKGWNPEGYDLVGVNVSNVGDVEVKNSVSVNSSKKADVVVTFTYQQKVTRATTYPLYGEWGYKDGNNWKVLKDKTELGRYAYDQRYDYTNEYRFDGFKVKPGSTYVSGNMPKEEYTVYFEYEKELYKLYAEYGYYDSNGRWRELKDTELLGSYYYKESYNKSAPETLKSGKDTYVVTNSPQSGRMPADNHTITFVYKKQNTAYTLYGRYGYYDGGRWRDLEGQKNLGTYKAGEDFGKKYPIRISGWSPVDPYLSGRMPDSDYTLYFEYVKGEDGKGVKNPLEDPVHTGDGDIGGGDNLPSDGPGESQPTKVPETDYPETPEDNPAINTPSKEPVKADQGDETHDGMSSGTGGQDHPVVDRNDGYTDNGDPPTTNPIKTDPNTSGTVVNTNPGHGGTSTTPTGGTGSSNPPSAGDTVKPEDTTPVGGTVDAGW